MKKIILVLFVAALFVGCRGKRGPVGPPGDGGGIIGQTFEFDGINFDYDNQTNLWSTVIDIPNDIEVLDSDAILAYLISDDGGVEVRELLPETFFTDQGTLTYVFNHTAQDIKVIIDGNYNLSNLDPIFTDNVVMRFVVVPSDFATDPNIDISTYEGLESTGIDLEEY